MPPLLLLIGRINRSILFPPLVFPCAKQRDARLPCKSAWAGCYISQHSLPLRESRHFPRMVFQKGGKDEPSVRAGLGTFLHDHASSICVNVPVGGTWHYLPGGEGRGDATGEKECMVARPKRFGDRVGSAYGGGGGTGYTCMCMAIHPNLHSLPLPV